MNTNTKYRCAYLEKQVTLDQFENPRPCCQFRGNIEVENYHKEAQEYVNRLHNGEQITECSMCWDLENKSIRSLRQQYNQSERIDDTEIPAPKITLTELDIRINNKCNLACTMCWSGASSLWGKLNQEDNELSIDTKSLDFVKTIEKDLKRISLQGGEPFFGNEYKEFLDSLQYKNQIQVEVFTNLITANEDDLIKWDNEFDKFILNVSADGIYERYSSIRWPTTWEKFNKKAMQILPKLKNVRFFYTTQNITVEYMNEFIHWRNQTIPNASITFPILQFPKELSLPYSTQEQVDIARDNIEYLLTDSPEKLFKPEIQSLKQVLKLLKQVNVKQDLIDQQLKYLTNVNMLRKHYSVRNKN